MQKEEALDRVFGLGQQRTVAVTSQRLMIVAVGKPNGWAILSIPWGRVADVALCITDEDEQAVQVTFTERQAQGRGPERGAIRERTETFCCDSEVDARALLALAQARCTPIDDL